MVKLERNALANAMYKSKYGDSRPMVAYASATVDHRVMVPSPRWRRTRKTTGRPSLPSQSSRDSGEHVSHC